MASRNNRLSDRTGDLSLFELIFDAIVRHQVGVLRYAHGVSLDSIAILNDSERPMRERILASLGAISRNRTVQNVARADRLIRQLVALRANAWNDVNELWRDRMRDLVQAENEFLKATYESASPTELGLESAALAGVLARSTFSGRTLTGWLNNMRATDQGIVATTIRTSIAQGEKPAQATRRLMGTARARGRNGTLQRTRNNIAAISRTTTNGFTNVVRGNFAAANPEAMRQEIFIATLDSRTTPICQATDGQIFDRGEGPIPPLHVACRSTRAPVLDPEYVGTRPANPTTEKELLDEYTQANGLARVNQRADLPHGTRGKFDEFKRRAIRRRAGPTETSNVTYENWLRRQPVRFQEEVLGVNKARLFRDGKLSLDRFVDENFRPRTLADMAKTDRQAFIDAGLDPDNPLWEGYLRVSA